MTFDAPPDPFNGPFSGYNLAPSPPHSRELSSQKAHRTNNDHHHHQKTRSLSPPTSSSLPTSSRSSDPTCLTSTSEPPPPPTMMMTAPPPFDVPKPWQAAMTMVSINAGLTPQSVLHHYYKLQPQQASLHHHHPARGGGYTELDIGKSQRAMDRGIRSIHVRYLDNDPSRIYMLVITIDHLDPATHRNMIRLVTTTSLRHVLEEPCANCPLWLPVKMDAAAAAAAGPEGPEMGGINTTHEGGEGAQTEASPSLSTSPYQLVPCCDGWIGAMDFDGPISAEEKQVPKVVDRLILEMQKKNLLLEAKEREVQAKEEELVRLREEKEKDKTQLLKTSEVGLGMAAAVLPVMQQREQHHVLGCDMEMLVQYWWAAAIVVAFFIVGVFR